MTLEQAKQYFASQGINAPDFVIEAWIAQLAAIQACLDANYDPGTAMLIQLYLISLFGLSQGFKYVSSERAPSGASRSYQYANLNDHWSGVYASLRALDTAGCTDDLVPTDPTAKAHGGIWVSRSGCHGDGL